MKTRCIPYLCILPLLFLSNAAIALHLNEIRTAQTGFDYDEYVEIQADGYFAMGEWDPFAIGDDVHVCEG